MKKRKEEKSKTKGKNTRAKRSLSASPQRSKRTVSSVLKKPRLVRGKGTRGVVRPIALQKFPRNPILAPSPSHSWETKATFNAGALAEDGRIHLLYRAIGDDDRSVIGYASSSDGFSIDERLDDPAYIAKKAPLRSEPRPVLPWYSTSSGGGSGGCEDPRLTRIGDRVFMFYTTFNGWPEQIAFTSIALDDFLGKRWSWDPETIILPPGSPGKNACVLSEKIGGKYVIFHRMNLGSSVPPNILIDFIDAEDFENKDFVLTGQRQISPRKGYWDSQKVGVGAPPIKTEKGWLLIYQGVGEKDPSRYKIGAMLLDTNDPTRVIARSREPILEPEEWYENQGWKSGVVYPCGAVVAGGQLIVYYGGADTYLCVASADFDAFLSDLVTEKVPKLTPRNVKRS